MNRAIVSLADSNYFELLLELINSIKRFPQSKDISICILDAGLKDNQLDILKKRFRLLRKLNGISIYHSIKKIKSG